MFRRIGSIRSLPKTIRVDETCSFRFWRSDQVDADDEVYSQLAFLRKGTVLLSFLLRVHSLPHQEVDELQTLRSKELFLLLARDPGPAPFSSVPSFGTLVRARFGMRLPLETRACFPLLRSKERFGWNAFQRRHKGKGEVSNREPNRDGPSTSFAHTFRTQGSFHVERSKAHARSCARGSSEPTQMRSDALVPLGP